MRFGLLNIDPVIAKAIKERLCGPRETFISEEIQWGKPSLFGGGFGETAKRSRKPGSEEKYALLLRKKRDDSVFRRTVTGLMQWCAAGVVASIGLWYATSTVPNHTMIAALIGFGIIFIGAVIARVRAAQVSQKRILEHEILFEELKSTLAFLTLTRAERVYCDVLVMLSQLEANLEARRTIRKSLSYLNDLLADARRLDRQRKSLVPALGGNPLMQLSKEQVILEDRVKAEQDDITRISLNQSLELVKTRIDNTTTLEQALQRILAQEEAIVNALATMQGAFARMQVAPSVQTDKATQQIVETVAEMNRQTEAVEKAVQEVLTMGSR